MPTPENLNWQPERRAWRVQYRKVRKTISVRQLKNLGYLPHDAPETKEGSMRAANAWFRDFTAKMDSERPAREPHPLQRTLDSHQRRFDYARRHGLRTEAEAVKAEMETVESITSKEADDLYMGDVITETARREMEMAETLFGMRFPPDVPPALLNKWFGADRVWVDRFAREQTAATPSDRTIAGLIDAYLEGQKLLVKAGNLTPARYDNLHYIFDIIRDHLGASTDATTLSETDVERFHTHMLAKIVERKGDPKGKAGYSESYADMVWGRFKAFVRYLYQRRLIELPRNLDKHKIVVKGKCIITCTKNEVTRLLSGAAGKQLELHILMMLNCGYRSTDIATLKRDEVDWAAGRIIRKRHKTEDNETTPVVNYLLWPRTFDLLKRWRSGGEIVLRTKSGGLWAFDEMTPDGKVRQSDSIATNFNRVRDDLGIKKPLKSLRSTAASELDENDEFARYAEHFLGEAPDRIARKHYVTPSQDRFDAAVTWLESRFKIG